MIYRQATHHLERANREGEKLAPDKSIRLLEVTDRSRSWAGPRTEATGVTFCVSSSSITPVGSLMIHHRGSVTAVTAYLCDWVAAPLGFFCGDYVLPELFKMVTKML